LRNAYAWGKRVFLRAPTEDDARGRWHEWFSDEQTTEWLAARYWPNTPEDQLEFLAASRRSRDRLVLSVVERGTDRLIGVCSLSSIDWINRYADIAVVIGEPEFRRGPVAIEIVTMLLRIGFNRLNLRVIKGGYLDCNPATRAILALFRFEEVGRFRDLVWCGGRYVDSVLVMLRRDDWLKRARAEGPG